MSGILGLKSKIPAKFAEKAVKLSGVQCFLNPWTKGFHLIPLSIFFHKMKILSLSDSTYIIYCNLKKWDSYPAEYLLSIV